MQVPINFDSTNAKPYFSLSTDMTVIMMMRANIDTAIMIFFFIVIFGFAPSFGCGSYKVADDAA